MHWNASPETQGAFNLWPWLTIILGFLRMFPAQGGQDNQLHEGWWGSWQAPGNNPSFGYRRQPSTVYRDNVADTAVVAERLSHFVCICIRHMSRAKYLHHAEATQKQPQIDDKDSTDHDMFKAIQRRYHSVRPWWKRLLFCARLSSVRYYEVCLSIMFLSFRVSASTIYDSFLLLSRTVQALLQPRERGEYRGSLV